MIQIKNKKTFTGSGYYIGRPSLLGNPFIIGRDGTRNQVIEKYKSWLLNKLQTDEAIQEEFLELVYSYTAKQELNLVCWCHPEPCHGDIIKEYILQFIEN